LNSCIRGKVEVEAEVEVDRRSSGPDSYRDETEGMEDAFRTGRPGNGGDKGKMTNEK